MNITKNLQQTTAIAIKLLEDKMFDLVKMEKCPICNCKLETKMNFWTCPKCHNDFFMSGKGKVFIWNREAGEIMAKKT